MDWVDVGDKKTTFFHRSIAARRAGNQIHYLLDQADMRIEDLLEIQTYCVDFYKGLMDSEEMPQT